MRRVVPAGVLPGCSAIGLKDTLEQQGEPNSKESAVSMRSRVLFACAVVAVLASVAGLIAGLVGGRVWQALPGLTLAVLVPSLYVLSRQQDRRRGTR